MKVVTKEQIRSSPKGSSGILREQFTRWDTAHHPEKDNGEHLDYETRSTNFSGKTIISYGYQLVTHLGNGNLKYEWISKKRMNELLKLLDE